MLENVIETLREDRENLLQAVKDAKYHLNGIENPNEEVVCATWILDWVEKKVNGDRIRCILKEKS